MSIAIQIDDLTVTYHRHPAIHHLAGAFKQGSLTAIVGPNGAGKSTLLSAIIGQIRPTTGGIWIDPAYRSKIAYLPQQAQLDRSFPIPVIDVVMQGHWARSGAFRSMEGPLHTKGLAALEAVGLQGFEQRLISDLSVGQFQRVLFARMLVQDAKIILLDEPFTAIDARTTAELLDIIRLWHKEARTVIAVLHDIDQVRENFPQTLLIAREAIAWGSTLKVLHNNNLLQARQLAKSWYEHAPVCRRAAG